MESTVADGESTAVEPGDAAQLADTAARVLQDMRRWYADRVDDEVVESGAPAKSGHPPDVAYVEFHWPLDAARLADVD